MYTTGQFRLTYAPFACGRTFVTKVLVNFSKHARFIVYIERAAARLKEVKEDVILLITRHGPYSFHPPVYSPLTPLSKPLISDD
jgi:hypothetical protein